MIFLIGLFFAMLIKPTSKYMDKPNKPIPTDVPVVVQDAPVHPVSSDPKQQVSDAISGEKLESDHVDTKQPIAEPIVK